MRTPAAGHRFRSTLAEGHVFHSRVDAPRHAFRYRVFMLLLDLDEMEGLDRRLRLFGVERGGILSFRHRDHLDPGAWSARGALAERLHAEGLELPRGRVLVLTNPRVLGYVFNPVSFWYCHDENDDLALVVAEVNNTFGDRHAYVLPIGEAERAVDESGPVLTWRRKKVMHVSPFMPPDAGTYRFAIAAPAERLHVSISLSRGGATALDSRLSLQRRPLTDRGIASALLRHPFMTLKVIAAIHYEALRLWGKRAPFWSRPPYDPRAAQRGPA